MNRINNETKLRDSNFELLRIVAMIMVMILHADYVSLGAPNYRDILDSPIISLLKVFFESACIISVNVFVLISGWYGIKPSIKGFSKFVFQCLFFSIGLYAVMLIIGRVDFSLEKISQCFVLTDSDSYWFIPSYICLYLFSPILNIFIQSVDKHTFAVVIIVFYIFQTLFAFIGGSAGFMLKGFSALSFMGLYLLAAYVRKYIDWSKFNRRIYFICYASITLLLTILYVSSVLMHVDFISDRTTCYSNPLVIISAISLLLYFAKFQFSNKIINKIGISCFAAYLLHCNPNVCHMYSISIRRTIEHQGELGYLLIFGVIIIWFFGAVLIDQLRIFIWSRFIDAKIIMRFKTKCLH